MLRLTSRHVYDHGMEPTSTSIAARWFGVRAEFEEVDGWRNFINAIKQFGLGLVTLGLSSGTFDPKRFCDVIIFRLDTGTDVAMFRYNTLEPADLHVSSLVERLAGLHVHDFCRELGIPIDATEGSGRAVELPVAPRWIATRLDQRRP